MSKRGRTLLKDENGNYVSRGWRNLKINGENTKPILAAEVKKQKNVRVFEHINITDLIVEKEVHGAYGFGITDDLFYEFRSKAVLVATGGAAGIYRPNNPEELSHQMWYPPFNTGAGYCMGILAGAEMTTFEMRFIALRCKDTIAPTGTIAQGVHAKQVNSKGEIYEDKYGLTTSERLWGTVEENRQGRGPCYLKTSGIDEKTEQDLYKAYLNMAPIQTLKWLDSEGPSKKDVEIEGTEPYIVGGHTASGYWVDKKRQTSIPGLFAAGDVAGGAPQTYVTGALAEGEIAAEGIRDYLADLYEKTSDTVKLDDLANKEKTEYEQYFDDGSADIKKAGYTPIQLEIVMQKIMDEYAGGIKTDYRYTEKGLETADENIQRLIVLLDDVKIKDHHDLLKVYELRDRLYVAKVLIAHLAARKETRWHSFQENLDHPGKDDCFKCYVNSVFENGIVRLIRRELVKIEE